MSNRPRRRFLRDARLRAAVSAGTLGYPANEAEFLAAFPTWPDDWQRAQRRAFRAISREPLQFADSRRHDPGLITIQLCNRRAPFNPLRDSVPEPPDYSDNATDIANLRDLWKRIEEAISGALVYLEPKRRHSRYRFDWDSWAYWRNNPAPPGNLKSWPGNDPAAQYLDPFEDYPVLFHRAFQRLSNNLMAVHQYGDGGKPWFAEHGQAARYILGVDPEGEISEVQLYALLALVAGQHALITLEGFPVDPKAWADYPDYAAELIYDADRWLAEAYRLEQADNRITDLRADLEPDAQRGKAQLKNLADMRDKQARASSTTLKRKEEWIEFDKKHVSKSTRDLNKSDRVGAVLQKFNLPESSFRTVHRALHGK